MHAFLAFIGIAILFDIIFNDGDAIRGIIRAIRGK
jgi:hypothetical protein